MSPAERAQAVALLTQAEALRFQGEALMHLADAQIRAAQALLGAQSEAGMAEAAAAVEQIFGKQPEQKARHYGSNPNQRQTAEA